MTKNSNRTSSAAGERRALIGYVNQYQFCSAVILSALQKDTIEWVQLVDSGAGRVDDFQIGTSNRVDAYQVKSSEYPESFTFNDLIAPRDKQPPLIHQLAEGWKLLRALHPARRIVVHLLSNNHPSTSDHVVRRSDRPTPNHFAAFLAQAWNPQHQLEADSEFFPGKWNEAWTRLQSASSLEIVEFLAFVRDCSLDFSFALPDDPAHLAKIDQLRVHLVDAVVDKKRIFRLTRNQILQILGLETSLRNRHVFPVDELLYEPITATIQELEQALAHLQGGYLAVIGPPGSGKSTLLTQVLRYHRRERIFRYYAYVPDAQNPTLLRGESANFLHDISLEISHAGFPTDASAHTREELLPVFHRQLRGLHENWEKTGIKSLILLDGLDHITRESKPQRSLLQDLPLPNEVPEGVYIILGTQTEQLEGLNAQIRVAVQDPPRRIEISSLDRSAVFKLTDHSSFTVPPTLEQREKIFQVSEGHPLALSIYP
jgi:energy-coupling factor transporter ATP-binding protein EcfA2